MGKENKEPKVKQESQFVNPFSLGVTYIQVIESMGEKSVREYLDGKEFTNEEIEGLEIELQHFKNKK